MGEYKDGIPRNRLDAITLIDDLEITAQDYMILGDIENAFKIANKIIKIAMIHDLSAQIKEQEEFLNSIAKKIYKEDRLSEITNACNLILEVYDSLAEMEEHTKAHEIVEKFKRSYNNYPDFELIPLVKKVLIKDKIAWSSYSKKK